MSLQDVALAAFAISATLAALGLCDRWARPRDGECPPVSPRAIRNLTSRLERERVEHPGRQS